MWPSRLSCHLWYQQCGFENQILHFLSSFLCAWESNKAYPRAWVLVLHREDPAGVPGSIPENEAFWVVNQLLEELSLDLPFSVTLPCREVSYSFKEIIKTQVNRKASQVRRLNIIKIGNNLSKFTLRWQLSQSDPLVPVNHDATLGGTLRELTRWSECPHENPGV